MRRLKRVSRSLSWLLLALWSAQELEAEQQKEFFQARQITKTDITFEHYICQLQPPVIRPLTGIEVWESAVGIGNPLNAIYWGMPNPEYELLERGLAELRDPSKSTQELREVQERAVAAGIGKWPKASSVLQESPGGVVYGDGRPHPSEEQVRDGTEPPAGLLARIWGLLKGIPSILWAILGILSVLGITVQQIWSAVHKKYYIEKRVDMVVIGEPSAGKTALLVRLHNPAVSSDVILGQAPSAQIWKERIKQPIPYSGRFQIYPRPIDVPGSKYGMAIDALHEKHDVLVVVVSHSKKNNSKEFDQRYIADQLKLVQILVSGSFDARTLQKPRALILFIAKFELLSQFPPTDSGAKSVVQQVEAAFKEHINAAKDAAERNRIPFACFLGSAASNWNCESVTHFVAEKLYGRR